LTSTLILTSTIELDSGGHPPTRAARGLRPSTALGSGIRLNSCATATIATASDARHLPRLRGTNVRPAPRGVSRSTRSDEVLRCGLMFMMRWALFRDRCMKVPSSRRPRLLRSERPRLRPRCSFPLHRVRRRGAVPRSEPPRRRPMSETKRRVAARAWPSWRAGVVPGVAAASSPPSTRHPADCDRPRLENLAQGAAHRGGPRATCSISARHADSSVTTGRAAV
jgi:hypothetical protein